MCGVLGYYSPNKGVDKEAFINSLKSLFHRGPDGYNYYFNKNVALGHTRLSIIDLSKNAIQPFSDHDESIFCVVNGEFYDYEKIREELKEKGVKFKSKCDSEILIYLYKLYGIDAIKKLNGEWAFILYDKNIDTIYIARDPYGAKPLYIYEDKNSFYFSSEIKCFKSFSRLEPNDNIYSDQVFTQCETFFKKVTHLRPGVIKIFNQKGTSEKEYFKPAMMKKKNYAILKSEQYYINTFKKHLDNAVKTRLRADVPVGVYLSGGIDSVTILALACKYLETIHTFSITFPNERNSDESYYINLAVNYFRNKGTNIIHHVIEHDDKRALENRKKTLYHTESLITDSASYLLMELSSLVRQNNFKVVLSGQGSDELLGGYPWMVSDLNLKPKTQKNTITLFEYFAKTSTNITNKYAKNIYLFIKSMLNKELYKFIYNTLKNKQYTRNKLPYTPSILHALTLFCNNEAFKQGVSNLINIKNWDEYDKFALTSYVDWLRMHKTTFIARGDRLEMANSVEARLPFLDKDVIQFLGTVPENLKINDRKEKYLLYEAMKGEIPDEIYQREKFQFKAKDSVRVNDDYVKTLLELLNSRTRKKFPKSHYTFIYNMLKHGTLDSYHFDIMYNMILLYDLFCED